MLHADHTLSDARMTGGFEALKKQRSGLARALFASTPHSTWFEVSMLLHLERQSAHGSGGCPGGWPKVMLITETAQITKEKYRGQLICSLGDDVTSPAFSPTRTRTRTNTNPNGTKANAAGRSVLACVARESKT